MQHFCIFTLQFLKIGILHLKQIYNNHRLFCWQPVSDAAVKIASLGEEHDDHRTEVLSGSIEVVLGDVAEL